MHRARSLDDLSERLRMIARQRKELDVTQLQIINLDEVRLAFGLKWSDVRERVIDTATSFLTNRLTPDDLLIPCGNGFVVVFGSLDGASAEIAGLQLARALNNFFIGEQGLDAFKVQCKHQTLELHGIASLVHTLGSLEPAVPVHGTLSEDGDADLVFRFLPQWDVKHEAISTFITLPYDTKGNPIHHHEEELGVVSRRATFQRDKATIHASVQALSRLLAYGDQAIIDVKLHASSLSDSTHRWEILQALGAIEPRTRRYFMVTIGDVVHGFPRYHLDELVHLIGQKVERVCIDISYDDPDLESIASCAAWGIGYRIPRLVNPLSPDVAEAIQGRLQRDAKRAHRHGKRLIVDVPGAPAMVHWCRTAGADFISCRSLWPAIEAPRGVERYELPKPAAA